MTPRHPWRRRWHDTIIPLLWLAVALGLIAFALVGCTVDAPPPMIVPTVSPGEQFSRDHAADICMDLDTDPTIPGVIDIVKGLRVKGLSDRESGVAIASSVIYVCPGHAALLQSFVVRYRRVQVL